MNNYRLFFFLLLVVISLTGCAGKNVFVVSELGIPVTSYETGSTQNFLVNYCVNHCEKKFNSGKLILVKKTNPLFFCLKINNPSGINYQIWVKYISQLKGKKSTETITKKICFSNEKIATYRINAPQNIYEAVVKFQILIKSGEVLLFELPTANYVVEPKTKGGDFTYGE